MSSIIQSYLTKLKPSVSGRRRPSICSLVLCPLSQKRIIPSECLCPVLSGFGYLDTFLLLHTEPSNRHSLDRHLGPNWVKLPLQRLLFKYPHGNLWTAGSMHKSPLSVKVSTGFLQKDSKSQSVIFSDSFVESNNFVSFPRFTYHGQVLGEYFLLGISRNAFVQDFQFDGLSSGGSAYRESRDDRAFTTYQSIYVRYYIQSGEI